MLIYRQTNLLGRYDSKIDEIYLNFCIPSAIPHGYFLPRTFLPSCSTTAFAPTTANGTLSLNNL